MVSYSATIIELVLLGESTYILSRWGCRCNQEPTKEEKELVNDIQYLQKTFQGEWSVCGTKEIMIIESRRSQIGSIMRA